MKRSAIKRNPETTAAFLERGRASSAKSLRVAALGRDHAEGARQAAKAIRDLRASATSVRLGAERLQQAFERSGRPKRKSPARMTADERARKDAWHAASTGRCENPACPGNCGALRQHHVVYEQAVRRAGGDVWDPDNGFTVGDGCHTNQHHPGVRDDRIQLTALHDRNIAFAYALLGEAAYGYLTRRYGGTDLRVVDAPTPNLQPDTHA